MYQEKTKRIHLTGKKLRDLNDFVHDRDWNKCIVCGAYVPRGEKFHHEPCGVYKSDEAEKAVTLCSQCHFDRHHGTKAAEVRQKCVDYLRKLYGEAGAKRE